MASQPQILAVVHDDGLRGLLEDVLSDRFQFSTAGDAMEGTSLLLSDRYDLLILEEDLPIMRGRDFVEALGKLGEFQTMPILMISDDPKLEAQIRGRPNLDLLLSPFLLDELEMHVRRRLEPLAPQSLAATTGFRVLREYEGQGQAAE